MRRPSVRRSASQPSRRVRGASGKVLAGWAIVCCGCSATAQPAGAQAPAVTGPACDKPVYLAFAPGDMAVAPLVAVVLRRQQVRATFLGSAERTATGDSFDNQWAPWRRARGDEGHAFVSATRDHVQWLGDEPGRASQFRVRPLLGGLAGRTFTWGAGKYCDNIAQAADRLAYLTGTPALPLFWPPGGRASPRLTAAAQACGYRRLVATPIAFLPPGAPSARGPSAAQIDQLVARTRAGDVLLAHLGAWSREVPQVPVGLDALIGGLKARGFCFATLRDAPAAPNPAAGPR